MARRQSYPADPLRGLPPALRRKTEGGRWHQWNDDQASPLETLGLNQSGIGPYNFLAQFSLKANVFTTEFASRIARPSSPVFSRRSLATFAQSSLNSGVTAL
jgi:hypothetical protein